jgi:hypothetical protein
MPGVSGLLNVHGVPTRPLLANEPGVVPCCSVEGLSPSGGSLYGSSMSVVVVVVVSGRAMGELLPRREARVRARRNDA